MIADRLIALSVVAVLVAFWMAIGLKGRNYRTFEHFVTARGLLKPWHVGLSVAASYASANLFLGVPGWAYTYGYPVFWWTGGCFLATWLGLVFFTKKFYRFANERGGGILTLPQWLGDFYRSRALRTGVAVLAMFNIFYIVGQNVGMATVMKTLVGLPYVWGVALTVLIVVVYIGFGGQFASIYTDAWQAILMSLTGLVIFGSLFYFWGPGALGYLHSGLEAQNPNLVSILAEKGIFSDWFSILSIEWLLFSFVLLPHLANRVLALDDEKQIKPFLASAGLGLFFVSLFMVFAGLAARVMYPALEYADSAVPVFVTGNFSPILAGLILGGIAAAVLSTADSLYMGMAAIVANDLVPGKKGRVLISRIAIVLIGAVSFYLSLNRPQSLTLLTQFGIAAILSGVAVPIGFAYWAGKKPSSASAFAAFLAGAVTYLVLQNFGFVPNLFKALAISTAVSFFVMFSLYISDRDLEYHRPLSY